MTKREARQREHSYRALETVGIDRETADKLRRIASTLHVWAELECGTGTGQTTHSVERDEDDTNPRTGAGRTYRRIQYPNRGGGYTDRRYPCADRETGAMKRLHKIMAAYPTLTAHVQNLGYLWILRPGDVPEGESADCYYSRGISVD